MKELGIKILDENNWLEPDKVLSGFHRIQIDGSTRPLTISEWFVEIKKAELEDNIPEDIQKLFEVARGTIAYGYFFYPIFTFASEQFTRIAETAVNIKCSEFTLPKSKNTFKKKVEWLLQEKLISSESYSKWESIIFLRNKFSHPSKRNIFTPFMAFELMNSVATNINKLFAVSG